MFVRGALYMSIGLFGVPGNWVVSCHVVCMNDKYHKREQGSSRGVPDARQLLQQVQGQLQTSWPQLQPLMDMPGAIEMRAELLASLSQRFFARTIKMIFGPQVRLPWYYNDLVSCPATSTLQGPEVLNPQHARGLLTF